MVYKTHLHFLMASFCFQDRPATSIAVMLKTKPTLLFLAPSLWELEAANARSCCWHGEEADLSS